MKERNYKRLCFSERITIETLLNEKKSKSYISKQLNRSRSTITREINKWVQQPWDKYDAKLAHWNAMDDNVNKRNLDKISTYPKLKIQVYRGLLKRLSPEAISGRLAKRQGAIGLIELLNEVSELRIELVLIKDPNILI